MASWRCCGRRPEGPAAEAGGKSRIARSKARRRSRRDSRSCHMCSGSAACDPVPSDGGDAEGWSACSLARTPGSLGLWQPSERSRLTALPGAPSSTKVRIARSVASSKGAVGLEASRDIQDARRRVMRGSGGRIAGSGRRAQASDGLRARNSLHLRVTYDARSLRCDLPARTGTMRHHRGKRKRRCRASHEGVEARSLTMDTSVPVQALQAPRGTCRRREPLFRRISWSEG